ncbi:hypothetical protein D3C81_1409730 [compost metagenome]
MARCQCTCHHAGRQFEAATYRRIKAFGNHIDAPVIEMPIWRDSRITREEVAQQRHDVGATETGTHTDLERAGRLPVGAGEVGDCRLDHGQAAADFGQEAFTGFGQGQAARTALEQAHTQLGLQPRHILAHRGRSQTQSPCSFREASCLCAADKTLDAAHAFHRLTLNL